MEFLNYIDGEVVASQSKNTFQKLNPFNGEVLGEVTASDEMDVIKAIQAAKKAYTEYEKWTLEQRRELLNKIADAIEAKADEIAYEEALHQGLSQRFVKEKSIQYAIQHFRKIASLPIEKDKLHQATGIISFILSWNLSFRLLSERLAPALLAGNVCLIKISELSPITGKLFAEIFQQVQLPRGLVQLIQGRGSEVGSLLAAHPSIRAVSFVGKLSNAENVIKAGIPQFKKVQIQSGVKNALFVLNETEFKNKMPQILESFLQGQGQLCWNTTRLFILESFQKEFMETLKETLAKLKPATSPKDESPWTPLITADAVEKTVQKIQQIKAEEGKIINGGEKLQQNGFFVQPTVSLDLPNCSEMQQDEISGPILIVTAVKYQHEMLKWANTGYYGHSAVVWGPEEKAHKVAEKVDAGSVTINSWFPENYLPGHRQSSFGNLDTSAWGSFYSDVKVLTVLTN